MCKVVSFYGQGSDGRGREVVLGAAVWGLALHVRECKDWLLEHVGESVALHAQSLDAVQIECSLLC